MQSQIEIGWAAGLFEGEGSIMTWRDRKRGLQTPRVTLMTTDEDVLRRFLAVVGVGRITGPYKYSRNVKQFWTWNAASFENVQYVIALFWSQLGRRRKDKAAEILGIAKLRPVKPSQRLMCPQGHPYDADNTSIVTYRSGPRSGLRVRHCKACRHAKDKARYLTPDNRQRQAAYQRAYRSRHRPAVIHIPSSLEGKPA